MASDEHWTDERDPMRTYFTRQVCPAHRRTKGIMSILLITHSVVTSDSAANGSLRYRAIMPGVTGRRELQHETNFNQRHAARRAARGHCRWTKTL